MKRTEDFRRHQREKHIKRKQRTNPWWFVKFRGQLDKGKSVCSCQDPTKNGVDVYSLEEEMRGYE